MIPPPSPPDEPPGDAERSGAPPAVTTPRGSPGLAPVRVTDRCAGCGACLLTCPTHAIRPRGGTLLVLAELCTGCIECIDVCPVDAIEETSLAAGPPGPPALTLSGGDR